MKHLLNLDRFSVYLIILDVVIFVSAYMILRNL